MINSKTIEILEEIKKVSGRLQKEKLLEKLLKTVYDSEHIFRYVFNDDVYGVDDKTFRKLIRHEFSNVYEDAGEMIHTEYRIYADDKLMDSITIASLLEIIKDVKNSSGNNLITTLDNIYRKLNADLRMWVTRIILKDLRIGIQLKTVNKVFKKLGLPLIKKFEVQLAGQTEIDDWKEYPCIAEEKIDGFRCYVEKSGSDIKMTSRQGKDVTEFVPELVEMFKTIKNDFVLDGEVMADNFNEIQKRIGRKSDNLNEIDNLHFVAFDIIQLDGHNFMNNYQMFRSAHLKRFVTENKNSRLRTPISMICYNKIDLQSLFDDIVIRNLGEGLIVKMTHGEYEPGSRNNWFKIKPVFNSTMKVIGVEQGTGKYKDTTGALLCENIDGTVKCRVGSGLTDEMRDYFRDNIKDHFIDVKYNQISKNKKGEYSLRHPRFDKIRFDKMRADKILK